MPKISDSDIEAVRQRANLLDIVSQHVQLKRSGRSYSGRCPFHEDSTPSFSVDPGKGLYHCFGCGAGGDVFSFVMRTTGLDFSGAVELLASKSGYPLTYEASSRGRGPRERLFLAQRAANHFFRRAIVAEIGREALGYAESRGITKELREVYCVGYAPNSPNMLTDYLQKKGFGAAEIVSAGLGSGGPRPRDRFRDRLMFPIFDLQDRIVGFGGRALGKDGPKYLNSPETAIYHKGSLLYGLNLARSEIIAAGSAVVVEGYTDVILLAGAGVRHVVATLGTAFGSAHLSLLSRFVDDVVLVFDGDAAGIAAAERVKEFVKDIQAGEAWSAVDKAAVRVIVLPDGRDPADFVLEKGAPAFTALLESARPFADFYLSRLSEKFDLTSGAGKRRAVVDALAFISSLSLVEQGEYLRRASDILGVGIEALLVEQRKLSAPGSRSKGVGARAPDVPSVISHDAGSEAEREVLKLALQFPGKVSLLEELEDGDWQDPLHRKLASVLKSAAQGKAQVLERWPESLFDEELMPLVSALTLDSLKSEQPDKYGIGLVLRLKEFSIERQINRLRQELGSCSERSAQRDIQVKMQALVKKKQWLRG